MCQTETFKSHTCHHQWMTIVKPCRPNASFNDQLHQYKPVRGGLRKLTQSKYISAPANSCPNCDKKGDYDADTTRFILKSPWEAGNIGNGYNMTDGMGNVLQPRFAYAGSFMPPATSYTACGVSRMSVPRQPWQQQGGCCIVM
jgi:hypothetical protein